MGDTPHDRGDIVRSVRRHAAGIAADVLALRKALDDHLAGTPGYGAAIRHLGSGLEQLQNLAAEIDRGLTRARPAVADLEHGDLDGGELVTR